MDGRALFILKKTLFSWIADVAVIALIFCWRLPKRKGFTLRLLMLPTVIALTDPDFEALLHLPNVQQWFTLDNNLNFTYLVRFLLVLLALWFAFDTSIWKVMFYTTAAHILQHLISSLANLIQLSAFSGQDTPLYLAIRVALTLLVFVLVGVEQQYEKRYENVNVNNRFVILFSLCCTMLLNTLNAFVQDVWKMKSQVTFLYASIVSVLLLVILFGRREMRRKDDDRAVIEALLTQQAKQKQNEIRNMDLINMKCHDLKHQIQALRTMSDAAERGKSIDELEQAVMIYDSKIKTGNPTLDILLTQKNLRCEAEHIRFTPMVDGAALSFLSTPDLYAIFGNVLDNAMEAAVQLPNEENRQISLRVERQGQMVRVICENRFQGTLVSREGEIQTTKEDKNAHGYGLKSIAYMVKKHGGHLATQAEGNRFSLMILFPNAEKATENHK